MLTEKYKNYTSYDFLKDKNFIRWQLLDYESDDHFWEGVCNKYPYLTPTIQEAINLFNDNVKMNDFSMSDSEIQECIVSLQRKITNKKKYKRRKNICLIAISTAAVVAVIIAFQPLMNNNNRHRQDIVTFVKQQKYSNDIFKGNTKLILSESHIVTLDNSESLIKYEEDKIQADGNVILKKEVSVFNQLITPYGKWSTIVFDDGTKAYLNAGSKLIFPSKFSKDKREIFLDGEAYIEVAKDNDSPFVIKTNSMDVKVLGTKFNVSAYEADSEKSVVLLSGSVSISSKNGHDDIILKPDQRYTINVDDSCSVNNVKAATFILWTQRLYQFENAKLSNVITRLERYYGISISADPSVLSITCSGKLDLKKNLNDLLSELAQALPIIISQRSDGKSYIVKSK